jgi:two-component system, OmpR family, heavy metal sensor histidine kinase CusS
MFSKPTEPRSIASQLVLLFTLAATVMLCCGLGVLYVIVVRHAFEEDNVFLADKILALRADLNRSDWRQALENELKAPRASEHVTYWVRALDSNGQTVAETPGMNGLLPATIFPASQKSPSALSPQDYRTGDKLFSLVAIPQDVGAHPNILQVAQDRSTDEQFSRKFGTLLIAVLFVGIITSAIIALTVTKRGLQPLAKMTRSLNRTGPAHLNERLARARWPRELQPMAAAFDEMLDRLEDSFTRLSQFSADLAHELRTPIANMLGEAEVTLTRVRTPEEYREVVESSAAECQRLSGIIDNLLFLARAETGTGAVHPTLLDGRAAVHKIVTFYETLAEEHQVSVTCAGAGDIWADSALFGRAVSNLIENALRSTPAGGKIVISIAPGPSQCEVSVSDNGCGIDAEHIPRVFDRFYRADSSRSSHGTGLGLALVKSITDLHGGTATLSSEPGRGTTVILTFPAKPAT